MAFQCANCQRPFGWHCDIHVIPCCPGKCPGYGETADSRQRSQTRQLPRGTRTPGSYHGGQVR